ncbi:MAG: VWA domain-containing protein [Myxococcales bacterium]|nr:MAG: VWA domain-containing protein [Myxococcales bacterium]
MKSFGFSLVLALLGLACGSGSKLCDKSAKEGGCGAPCSLDPNACAEGYFCDTVSGVCSIQCSVTRNIGCKTGNMCTTDGRCVPSTDADTGDGGLGDGNICADVTLSVDPIIPNIMVIVDQSSSMANNEFSPGVTRWDALRQMLIGATQNSGLLFDLQDKVSFGFAMYTGFSSDPCPTINNPHNAQLDDESLKAPIAPTLQAYNTIYNLYATANAASDTPTGDAIKYLREYLQANPPANDGPTFFILATDGEPDYCAQLNPQTEAAKTFSIEQVTASFNAGIKTYAVAIGNEVGDAHMQDIANAGAGVDVNNGGSNVPFYRPADAATLRSSIEQIVRGERDCTFELQGRIADMARVCTGTVSLTLDNGNPSALECGGANGWEASDDRHIKLKGSACENYKNSDEATVQGVFPCDVASDVF